MGLTREVLSGLASDRLSCGKLLRIQKSVYGAILNHETDQSGLIIKEGPTQVLHNHAKAKINWNYPNTRTVDNHMLRQWRSPPVACRLFWSPKRKPLCSWESE